MLFLFFVIQFILSITSYEIKVTRVDTQPAKASPYSQKLSRNNLVPYNADRASVARAQLNTGNVAGTTTCSTCIQAAVIEINLLANQILNGVIVNDCEELCALLSDYGWYAVVACDAVCLGFGIDEFINLIVNEDIDPIWYCEILDMCTIDDCQGDCLDITVYITRPNRIPQGGVVNQYFTVDVKKPWNGTGMFTFVINDPVQGQQQQDALLDGGWGPVGTATYSIQIPSAEAQLTPNVTISSQIFICNGECGSKHPHSRIFSQASTTFVITPESEEVSELEETESKPRQLPNARGLSAGRDE